MSLKSLEGALLAAEEVWFKYKTDIGHIVKPYWTPTNIFNFFVAFYWILFLWKNYLFLRQYRLVSKTENIPSSVCHLMERETFQKARLYKIDSYRFGLLHGFYSQIISTIVLYYHLMPKLWYLCAYLLKQGKLDATNELLHSATFILIGSTIATIHELPWDVYSTFVVEQRHGFNNQTAGFYVKDKIKQYIVTNIIVIPIICGSVQIIKMGGDYFFLYLWAFVVIITFVIMIIYPTLIAPLFDKFVSLPDGELRKKIEDLAASINFPLTGLYVVEGSRRSAHSNAYMYGMWKSKRIVLFDTLVKSYNPLNEEKEKEKESDDDSTSKDSTTESAQGSPVKRSDKGCTDDEVLAVLCHELGHWQYGHNLRNLVISQIHLMLCFIIFAVLYRNKPIYQAFGFYDEMPILIGMLLIFEYIFGPYNAVVEFLMTCLTRKFEFEADEFARKQYKASYLRDALIKLNTDNLSFPLYDWLFSMCNNSHPPLLERIEFLGKSE